MDALPVCRQPPLLPCSGWLCSPVSKFSRSGATVVSVSRLFNLSLIQ